MSAVATTFETSVLDLLVPKGWASFESVTVAVFEMELGALFETLTGMDKKATAFAPIEVVLVQVTVWPGATHVNPPPPLPLETNVSEAGSTSCTVTVPEVAALPVFVN